MGETQPAKIAKYLLKGYCLLNDYCPKGNSVPLVRSREGVLICCCSDPTCKYSEENAAQASSGRATAKAAVSQSPVSSTGAIAGSPKELGGAFAPQTRSLASAPAVAGASGSGARASSEVEITLQGAAFRFGCVRLAAGSSHRVQLLGASFAAKVRIGYGASACLETEGLRAALGAECRRLHERVLLPGNIQLSRAAGQVVVACSGGGRFELPEIDIVVLPDLAGSGSAEGLASLLAERLLGSSDAMAGLAGAAAWMEVSVADGAGEEASVRRSFLTEGRA